MPGRCIDSRSRSRATDLRAALAPALLLLVCASPIAAQDAPVPGQAAAPISRANEVAIPIPQIGVASERSKRIFAETEQTLVPPANVLQIADALPALSGKVAAQLAKSQSMRESGESIVDLDQLQRDWAPMEGQLAAAQAALSDRSKQIEEQVERIRRERQIWTATRTLAAAQEVNPEVLAQIDGVERAGRSANDKANERQAAILGLQSEVASLSEQIAVDLRSIQDRRNTLVGQVLKRDAPAMWSLDFWSPLGAGEIERLLTLHQAREESVIREYFESHPSEVVVYLISTALLCALMLSARRRIDQRLVGDELEPIRAIFDRPFSLAFIISFFVAIFSAPDTLRLLAPVLGAASLVPAVLILHKILDRPLFPLLNVVTGIYFFHQLREIFAPVSALYRLLFLVEATILLLVCGWWLRPARLRDTPREMTTSRLFRIVGYGLRAVFFLSTAALLANLGGYVALANLIGRTVVWSTYAAVVLYGATRVVDALVVFVLQVPPLSVLGMVSDHRFLIRQRTSFVVHVAAWYFWIRSTLGRAELRDDVQTAIDAIMAWNLPLPEVEITLGDILASGVTFYAALLLSRFIRFMLEEDVYPYLGLAKGRPYAISTLIHYSLVIIGFLLAAAALGFDMNRFTLLAGAFGVGIGFGLQTIVNNFLSGIILLTERPIQVGDTITLGDVMGEIQRIGIRSSTVRTWQGAEVIVPNADLIAHQVTNWTLTDRRRRIEIPVGVAYGSDPRLVLETLVAVGQACEQVLADPAPYALFLGFGDSALNFELRAWTDDFDAYIQVRSRLCTGIFDALAAAGLEIPFPQRDLHIRTLADPVQSASPTEEPSVPARATGDASADRDSRVG